MRWSLPKQAFSFAIAYWLAVALSCGPVSGQSTDQDSSDETAAVDLHEQLDRVISLEMDNPRLRDFVIEVQAQVPLLNVVVEEAVKEIPVPAVKLQRVRAGAALESLAQLTGRRVAVNISENESFLVVRVDNESAQEMELTEVFNVRSWLEGKNPQVVGQIDPNRLSQLMDAIKTGLTLLESTPDQLKFSLHETTGLLFVRGQHREVELVQRIVSELQRDLHGSNPFGGGGGGAMGGATGVMGGMFGAGSGDPEMDGGGAGLGGFESPGAGRGGGAAPAGGASGGGGEPDGSPSPEPSQNPLER